jgi:class 3 adenylate cyclase
MAEQAQKGKPMTMTLDEALRKIRELEEELQRSKEVARFGMTGTLSASLARGSMAPLTAAGTVLGVEELILTVDGQGKISFLNSPMAFFLQAKDRRAVIGEPLAKIDQTSLGPGFFSGIVEGVRGSAQPWIVERECPELDASLLPQRQRGGPLKTASILRMVANSAKGSVTIVIQNVTEIKWLERNFARYVSPEVLLKMHEMAETDFFKAERREISILFGDLRGFTKMSSEMSPEDVHQAVNSFFAEMVASVKEFNGTVDKFIGDQVMALFGAPLAQPHHALLSLVCGVDMQKRHLQWMERRTLAGKPAPGLGVGIASGEAVVANVGTAERMEYTALGHTVNLAARLCGDAQGGEILTVPHSYHAARAGLKQPKPPLEKIPHLHFESLGRRTFKNISEPVEVLKVTGDA